MIKYINHSLKTGTKTGLVLTAALLLLNLALNNNYFSSAQTAGTMVLTSIFLEYSMIAWGAMAVRSFSEERFEDSFYYEILSGIIITCLGTAGMFMIHNSGNEVEIAGAGFVMRYYEIFFLQGFVWSVLVPVMDEGYLRVFRWRRG